MPPYWVSALIVAGWLAASSWLFYREYYPYLQPDAPPPFAVDLVEESTVSAKVPIRWSVYQNGVEAYQARTRVEHRSKEDDFTFHAEIVPALTLNKEKPRGAYTLKRMESAYTIQRDGTVQSIHAHFIADIGPAGSQLTFEGWADGTVEEGQMAPTLVVKMSTVEVFNKKLNPVPVSRRGSVYLPLHPVNRISGLRPGQTWRVPQVNPMEAALMQQFKGEAPPERLLQARVLHERQTISYHNVPHTCLVIEYTDGEEMSASTWVHEDSGLVLRQEAKSKTDHWVLVRD